MNTEGNAIPAAHGASGREGAPGVTDLAGQVAVVTGASRGIGRAIAIRLGRLGASVVVNYSRDANGAAETVAAIKGAGSQSIDIRADVSKPAEIEVLLDTATRRFGRLDMVVANAGLDEGLGPVLDVTEAEYDRIYNVNAKGAFFTLQQAARVVNSGGSIV
jgi:3-oxoacyl-[acyl-carrier protein] reductase